jgi:hypothetical protein
MNETKPSQLRELSCGPEQFFALARERYRMRERRLQEPLIAGGNAPFTGPWSDDPVLAAYRFCNVHREHDKTTEWFRVKIRDGLRTHPGNDVVATVGFRWFNRIETAEHILDMLQGGEWDSDLVRRRLQGVSPLVTGAYMIKTPTGKTKLEGIIWCMEQLLAGGFIERLVSGPDKTLEEAHAILVEAPFLGPFMAYEVVSDLRHTTLLQRATDITTWANPGPGCARGLGWVLYGNPDVFDRHKADECKVMLYHMGVLLAQTKTHWPDAWPRWEMREVEHWLCEYAKWCTATYEGKSLKRRFAA